MNRLKAIGAQVAGGVCIVWFQVRQRGGEGEHDGEGVGVESAVASWILSPHHSCSPDVDVSVADLGSGMEASWNPWPERGAEWTFTCNLFQKNMTDLTLFHVTHLNSSNAQPMAR